MVGMERARLTSRTSNPDVSGLMSYMPGNGVPDRTLTRLRLEPLRGRPAIWCLCTPDLGFEDLRFQRSTFLISVGSAQMSGLKWWNSMIPSHL